MQTHIQDAQPGWEIVILGLSTIVLLVFMSYGTNATCMIVLYKSIVYRPFKAAKRFLGLKKKRKIPKLDVGKQITESSEISQNSVTKVSKLKPISRSPNPARVSKQSVTQQGDARNISSAKKAVKDALTVKTHAPIGIKMKPRRQPSFDNNTTAKEESTTVQEEGTPVKEESTPVKEEEYSIPAPPEVSAVPLQKRPKRLAECKVTSVVAFSTKNSDVLGVLQSNKSKAINSTSDCLSTVTDRAPVANTPPRMPSNHGPAHPIKIDAPGSKKTKKQSSTEKEILNLTHNAIHSNVSPSRRNVGDVSHQTKKTPSLCAPAKAEVSLPLAAATSACPEWSNTLSASMPAAEEDLVLSPDVVVPDVAACSDSYSGDAATVTVGVSSDGILALHTLGPVATSTVPNDVYSDAVEESHFSVPHCLSDVSCELSSEKETEPDQRDANQSYFLPSLSLDIPVSVKAESVTSPTSACFAASMSSAQGDATIRPSHEHVTHLNLENALYRREAVSSFLEDPATLDWEVSRSAATFISLEGSQPLDEAFALRTPVDAVACQQLNESWMTPDAYESWTPTDALVCQQLSENWTLAGALMCEQLNESWTSTRDSLLPQQLNQSWAPTDAFGCLQLNECWTHATDAFVHQQLNQSWTPTNALMCQAVNEGSIPTDALVRQQLNESWTPTDALVCHELSEGSIPTNALEDKQLSESWTLTEALVYQELNESSILTDTVVCQELNETCRKDDIDSVHDDDDNGFTTQEALINLYKSSLKEFFEGADYPKDHASTRSTTFGGQCVIPDSVTPDNQAPVPSSPRLRVDTGSTTSIKDEDGEQKPKKDQRQPMWSIGAEKHFEGRCQPCGFYYKKDCRNGSMCVYCHMCPRTELKRRKKDKVAGLRRGEPSSTDKSTRKQATASDRKNLSEISTFSIDALGLSASDAALDTEQSLNTMLSTNMT
eukprot:GEMP01004735.1.p1 GENE.GEMP01004735.1~~GEMP01004735.1.p1  ORF type:complete len:946 (+),score=165.98 GEMP01004735.1:178-3015(+)